MRAKTNWLFFGDFVRLHVLCQAARKPAAVEEFVAALNRLGYRFSQGLIRTVLRELAQEGYLTSRHLVGLAGRRRYFEATVKGRKAISVAKKRIRSLADQLLYPLPDVTGL